MPHKFKREDALADPKPTGKMKVIRVRDELWARVDVFLKQIEEKCAQDVNHLAQIRREASYCRLDHRNPTWGQYGPNQGNVGKHVDALAGVVYGYMESIALLDEILGDDSIQRRNNKVGQDQAEEEGQEDAGAQAASAEAGGDSEEPVVKPRRARAGASASQRPARKQPGSRRGRAS